jgi:hypothetical protein
MGPFQASRARDAVYGYLEAVFAIVEHYKVRRRTNRLLRHAFKFANLPFDRNADPFTAVIRCTCDGAADNKIISKWARALRYVAHCKKPRTRLKTFMKKAGGSMPALLPMQNLSGAVTDVIEGHSRLCRSPQGLWRWRAWWPRWWRFRFNQAALLRRANKRKRAAEVALLMATCSSVPACSNEAGGSRGSSEAIGRIHTVPAPFP